MQCNREIKVLREDGIIRACLYPPSILFMRFQHIPEPSSKAQQIKKKQAMFSDWDAVKIFTRLMI